MTREKKNADDTAVFGGGCFWCTEAVFQSLKGVSSVTPGYAGGKVSNPTYEMVSAGGTGHAEVIKIEFDPQVVSYHDLLNVFFATHDPATPNQQGSDRGEQYRSVIFYASEAQKTAVEEFVKNLIADVVFERPIVTEIRPLENFYPAEEYHRNYYQNNPEKPYCQVVISPKLAHLRVKFGSLLKL